MISGNINKYRCTFVSAASKDGYHFSENKVITVGSDGIILLVEDDYQESSILDLSGYLTIPAFSDLHLHASQLDIRGIGYDLPLDGWFNDILYPAEEAYDLAENYKDINRRLINELWRNGIVNASVLCAVGLEPVLDLMNCFEKSGLSGHVGKMNCDINPNGMVRENLTDSLSGTKIGIEYSKKLSNRVSYVVTPEYIPTCSTELMTGLGNLVKENDTHVQAHFAEGEFDSVHVRLRYPGKSYLEVYQEMGLLNKGKTLVIHGISGEERDDEIIRENDLILVHCGVALSDNPSDRNFSLSKALSKGLRVGYGSDIGGSGSLNPFDNMVALKRYSNVLSLERNEQRVSLLDVFTLMTKGSGSYFGKYGVIEPGYYFSVLVIDDQNSNLQLEKRWSHAMYTKSSQNIMYRFHNGKQITQPFSKE